MVVNILPDSIRRMMTRETRPATGAHEARVVSVCAQKGGVGKTTTAVHVAAALALYHGRKVLLVDMDSQGHVQASLQHEIDLRSSDSLSQVLLGRRRDLMEIALPTRIAGLWVTPSDKELNETESLLSSRIGKEFLLRGVLRTARTHFDVILLDCPPNLGNLTLNALLASDQVLVPCDMSILSLEGVRDLLDALETIRERLGHPLGILGLVRTRVDRRNRRVNADIQGRMDRAYGPLLLATEIPVSTALSRAQLAGVPVFQGEPQSSGATAYSALAREIDLRLGLPANA